MATDPGRRAEGGRVAVIDIGSNSIRLVIYDRLWRAPVQQFNEKILCGLGRHLGTTGRLGKPQMALALANLVRFVRLAEAMHVEHVDVIATEAVRAAKNGAAFVADIERRCGLRVDVLSGEDEARLSAMGVLAGNPGAEGLMGDLGGASLEISRLEHGGIGGLVSLPLGPLRLIEAVGRDPQATRAFIDRHLADIGFGAAAAGQGLYCVGGSWRSLARFQMERTRHPLHVIHGYRLARAEAETMVRSVTKLGRRGLGDVKSVSRKRIETLPMAAIVLERLLAWQRPEHVTFSAFGLREGRLFSRLSPVEALRDPLLASAADLAAKDRRFDDMGELLLGWTDPLFQDQPAEARRLRLATCHFSDIAWREHPDYRASQALMRLLLMPLGGAGHAERAFLAYALFIRYGGTAGAREAATALALLTPEQRREAEILGRALGLAYALCGGAAAILERSHLVAAAGRIQLVLPDDGSVPHGEAVDRRLRALAKAAQARGRTASPRIRYRPAVPVASA